MTKKVDKDVVEKKKTAKTLASLSQLENQMDLLNSVLFKVKGQLKKNNENTVDFLRKVNEGD